MDPKLINMNNHRAAYNYGHDFVPLILKRISWCNQHNTRISEAALVRGLMKKYTSARWTEGIVDTGIQKSLGELYKKRQIVIDEDGFLKISQEPKYPLWFFADRGAITLTILDFFKMRQTTEPRKRVYPLKEDDFVFLYRKDSAVRKRNLIEYISTRRKAFKHDIVECAIDKLIDLGILLCYEPDGAERYKEENQDKEFGPYHGGDGVIILNELGVEKYIPGPYADDYKEQFGKIGM
jgi:hypothetical protein